MKGAGRSESDYDDDDFEEGGDDESSIYSPPCPSSAGTNNPAVWSLLTSDISPALLSF